MMTRTRSHEYALKLLDADDRGELDCDALEDDLL